jgi:hypothetical protein
MGFNPFRPAHNQPLDVFLVVTTIVAVLVMLAWAIWG